MIWTYLIIYAFAFGILSAMAVRKKNRDQVSWFFLGLLFGVFGLIAGILVDKIEKQTISIKETAIFDSSQLSKKCPDCAELIKLEAKICRFCQHKFSDEEVAQEIAEAEKSFNVVKQNIETQISTHWECPNCHCMNRNDVAYCLSCSTKRSA